MGIDSFGRRNGVGMGKDGRLRNQIKAKQQSEAAGGTDALDSDQVAMPAGGPWGALQASFEEALRDAYAQGQTDAYLRAADLIHELHGPSLALTGHTMRHPEGAYSVEVPDECGYEMADKVLAATSDGLRAYASAGFRAHAEAYVARTTGRAPAAIPEPETGETPLPPMSAWAPEPETGDTPLPPLDLSGTPLPVDTCKVCMGSGYGREIGPAAGGGTLHSGECQSCFGEGTLPVTDSTRQCDTCDGSGYDTYLGRSQSCAVCGGSGDVPTTAPDQEIAVVPGFGRFARVSEEISPSRYVPDEPYAFRLEANRPLTDEEIERAASLFGYSYKSTIAGEPVGYPTRDSDRSFIVSADTTKSRRSDTGAAMNELLDDVHTTLFSGSPVRTTDRSGPGTKGTRAVEGLGDPNLRFALYADDYSEVDR